MLSLRRVPAGIEALAQLKHLNASSNRIATLVQLAGNVRLTTLLMGGNLVKSLDGLQVTAAATPLRAQSLGSLMLMLDGYRCLSS